MVKQKRRWIWFAVGVTLSACGIFAPIHESGHLLAMFLEGKEIVFRSFDYVAMDSRGALFVPYAGYTVEVLFLIGIYLLLRHEGKECWFLRGAIHSPLLMAPLSSDFGYRARQVALHSDLEIWIARVVWVQLAIIVLVVIWKGVTRGRVDIGTHRQGFRVDVEGRPIPRGQA